MIGPPTKNVVNVGYTITNLAAYPDYRIHLVLYDFLMDTVKQRFLFEPGKHILCETEGRDYLVIEAVNVNDTTKRLQGNSLRTYHKYYGKKLNYVVDVMEITHLNSDKFKWETKLHRYHYHAKTKKGALFGDTWASYTMLLLSSSCFFIFIFVLQRRFAKK